MPEGSNPHEVMRRIHLPRVIAIIFMTIIQNLDDADVGYAEAEDAG